MKIFAFLSCFSAAFADISGELKISYNTKKEIVIQGDLTGLPASMAQAGIHVHSGTECQNKDLIGGHLYSDAVDGWLSTKYTTDSDGTATIDLTGIKGYTLATSDAKAETPSVENRCVVMHGISSQDTGTRVAVGQILEKDGSYSATFGPYPGLTGTTLQPFGRITVTNDLRGGMQLKGSVSGLAPNLIGLGIHIHTGTDCTEASKVGGHLLYRGDGFANTKYDSDGDGKGTINIKTPPNAYLLLNKDATGKAPAVQDHCIVIHSRTDRVAVGKIVCADTSCTAKMQPYPKGVVVISGTLKVSMTGGIVTIRGIVEGLPRSKTAGVHVHSGTECTNYGLKDKFEILSHIGGHLLSKSIDGWAYPKPTAYNTNADGDTTVDVTTRTHYLNDVNNPATDVLGRCIVLHGVSKDDMSSRVAVGKIEYDGNKYRAKITKYPGDGAGLTTVPTGTLTVTAPSAGVINVKGDLTGMGKNLQGAGIHIHTGKDCTGGGFKTAKKVNEVIGGHLRSPGDGFSESVYTSNINGESTIEVATPSNAYTLHQSSATDEVPAVENRCIVIHDSGANRVGIGQIICESRGACEAKIVPYPTPVGPLAGILGVSYDKAAKIITIRGDLTGLPSKVTNAGIHVHAGKACDDMNAIGGHLYTNTLDSWVYPSPVTYRTNAKGEATIIAKAKNHFVGKADAKDGKTAVEDHCIVMHGVSALQMGTRVATGKIVKEGNSYTAQMGKYPGPPSGLATTPSGKLTISTDGDFVMITGSLTGLGKDLQDAGIHVHTGTDCTGGSDLSSIAKVNAVIGGHLPTKGDGFLKTFYSSNQAAKGYIDIATPKGAYVLREKDTSGPASVENRCIVLHDGKGVRVGVGKIVCTTETFCKAVMKPYPTKQQAEDTTTRLTATTKPPTASTASTIAKPTTTTASTTADAKKPTTSQNKVSGAVANFLISVSSLVAYCIVAL